MTGRAAAHFKELICKQAVWQITLERWLPGVSGKPPVDLSVGQAATRA